MRYIGALKYPAILVASLFLIAGSGRQNFSLSIGAFEKTVKLPKTSFPIRLYARYYKSATIKLKSKSNNIEEIVHFKYIRRNQRVGIYIISASEKFPNTNLTDGGCLTIEGFYRVRDGKLLSLECSPER